MALLELFVHMGQKGSTNTITVCVCNILPTLHASACQTESVAPSHGQILDHAPSRNQNDAHLHTGELGDHGKVCGRLVQIRCCPIFLSVARRCSMSVPELDSRQSDKAQTPVSPARVTARPNSA